MKKAPIVGMAALFLVGVVAAIGFALPLGGFGKMGMPGDNDAVKEAIENRDYDAYMTALEEGWQAYKAEITEERFNEIVEHQNQMQEMRAAREAKMEKAQQALENGDYAAWQEAIEESPRRERIAEVITEDNFDTYVEMHEAIQNGDFETANQLAQELGVGHQGGCGNAFGQGPRGVGMMGFR